ncbi:MAG: hypothetical protein HQ510_06735 [Candidatus Marinimicrobia bacterium]|nr:hypothetical protein [Candidatus Neomarinimicrobiota bacterium]
MKYLSIIILLFISTFGWAQPARPDGNDAQMLKKWKLVEYLELSEDQSIRFFPRIEKFENTMEDIRKERRRLYEDIENDLDRGNDIELSELNEVLEKYRDLEQKELQLKHEHISNMKDILTPTQIARYSIFEHKFRIQMKENINKRKNDPPKRSKNRF